MNNFFYSSSDYDLFKKAFRSTKNEPVIINVLSDDVSLNENNEAATPVNAQRKQMSSKYQASPFDKFFGPRKKRTDPLDMKDFSSWKNKNYRESEKEIDSTPEETTKFSFSDYLNSRTKDKKYNNEDELKAETQKSIEQMGSDEEGYKKFSLDSYLNKLEQQTKAKKDFEETDDLVSDFIDESAGVSTDSDQDENFISRSDVGVEDIAFGGEIKGDKFSFDREELDIVKARLEKMEREANNIKDKPTTKVISKNELTDIAKTGDENDDEFNLDKLGIEDDIEKVNKEMETKTKALQVTGDGETDTPKVSHQKFVEIKKSGENDSDSEEIDSDDIKDSEDSDVKVAVDISGKGSGATVIGGSSGSGASAVIVTTGGSEPQDGYISMPAKDMSGKSSEDSQVGVVKPVVIVGATADASELKEGGSSSGGSDTIVDAVEFTSMDGEDTQEVAGTVDGFEATSDDELVSEIKKTDDYITKTDLRNVTDEIIGKVSEMTRPDGVVPVGEYGTPYGYAGGQQPFISQQAMMGEEQYSQMDGNQPNVIGVFTGGQPVDYGYKSKQDELQAQLMELIEQNKRTDEEVARKLEMAEMEKIRVAEEYESRLRELEESMQRREEAVKQQAYIDKLKNDIKFKKSENKFRLREEQIRESEKSNSQTLLDCEKLKSELRNSLSVSNLEMDKKLLECVNKLHKEEIVKQEQKVEELKQDLQEQEEEQEYVQEEVVEKVTKPRAPRTTSKRRPSTVKSRMRTRTPRRRIDSDIIGGINFD